MKNLPRDSATARSLAEHPDWDDNAELLATVIDAVNAGTFAYMRVHFENPRQPALYPRPGAVEPAAETIPLAQLGSMLLED